MKTKQTARHAPDKAQAGTAANAASDLSEARGLYGAGLVTSLTGVAAISAAVESATFLAAAGILIAIGYFISVRLRAAGRTLRIVEVMVVAICLATYARLFSVGEGNPILNPGISAFHKELSLAVMLVWAEVVRSYALVSDEAVLFASVPSLALIGVVTTTSPGPDTLFYFAVWLVSSVTMFVETGQGARVAGARSRSLTLAGGLGVGAIAAGMLVSPVLHKTSLTAFMTLAPELYSSRRPAEVAVGDPAGNVLPISGGPVRLTSKEVMRVTSDIGGYWRARVWSTYSGRDWMSMASAQAVAPVDVTLEDEGVFRAPEGVGAGDSRREVVQTFRVISAPETYVFAASEPVEVVVRSQVLQRDQFNCWRFTTPQTSPVRTYTVTSSVPDPSPMQMRRASRSYPPDVEMCIRVPLVADRVAEVAREVAGRERTPYDKVVALQRYLSENYTYDLQAPRMPATEDDAVSFFLFTSRRGYCDIFASALAIMARCVGVPARIATGYAHGDQDPETGQWIVRDRDRHSWTEVYFSGYGWVPFEATPSSESPEVGFWASVWSEMRLMGSNPATRALLLVAALAMALAALRLVTATGPEPDIFERSHVSPAARAAQKAWRRLARRLRAHDVRPRRSSTPLDLYRMADVVLPVEAESAREALRLALDLITAGLYSNAPDSETLVEDLDVASRMAAHELSRVSRRGRAAWAPLDS